MTGHARTRGDGAGVPGGVSGQMVSGTYQRIYAAVKEIPSGRVATYGQIARLAGIPNGARQVGYALNALREGEAVPWHRVINARGEVSPRSDPTRDGIQRRMLEREGVRFSAAGRVSFELYRWQPAPREA
jgi:methylated-DNA-protein-cysteine methyltransferase-like protein